jgi:tetratricopeptide (TPR) repeat protein
MPRDPDADSATLKRLVDLAQRKDWRTACALASEALAGGLEHPLVLTLAATLLEHEQGFKASLPLRERAVALAPNDFSARNALAICLMELGRSEEALEAFELGVTANPNLAFAHYNKGAALLRMKLPQKARASFTRTLELDPHYFHAKSALMSIASVLGQQDEAEARAREVLAEVPNFPEAVTVLAAAEIANHRPEAGETRLRNLLANGALDAERTAAAWGTLGDALDAQGRYAGAFDAYSRCNNGLRELHRQFASGATLNKNVRSVNDWLRKSTGKLWAGTAPSEDPSGARGHAFLIGFPRSGTTLLETILDGNPSVASLEEHDLIRDAVLQFLGDPPELDALASASESELQALRVSYWERVRREGIDCTGKLFVDKNPLHTVKLPLIARLFPKAKILFAIRDPRDVVLSCYRRRFNMNRAMYELLTLKGAVTLYELAMECGEMSRVRCALDWYDIRYERLVEDLSGEMRRVCEFLDLEWAPGMIEFSTRGFSRQKTTPSTAQLAGGLSRKGVDHWRHYERALDPVLPRLAPWVQRFGYSN